MSTERTLVLIKPDGVARKLSGSILARIEAKGYTLVELKKVDASRERFSRVNRGHGRVPAGLT